MATRSLIAVAHVLVARGLACLLAAGCTSTPKDQLIAPRILTSPYDTSRGESLWAVAPLRNESGTSIVRSEAISDHVVATLDEVEGVRCLPLNRTLGAMESLGLTSLKSAGDARRLAAALGADAVVVGSITSYDPYTPVLGMTLSIYPRPGSPLLGGVDDSTLDVRSLTTSTTDPGPRYGQYGDGPLASVSKQLDGKNHQVLMELEAYAQGRTTYPSAMGWKRYLASMDLFSQFAAYRCVDALLQQEWTRTARANLPILPERPAVSKTAGESP